MKRYLARFACALCGALLLGGTATANIVDSSPRKLVQPDGTTFTAIKHGDEHLFWIARPDGRPIARGRDGVWYLVREYRDGKTLLSRRPAHGPAPKWRAPLPRRRGLTLGFLAPDDNGPFDGSGLTRGTHDGKVLIIAVEFSDRAATHDGSVWASRIVGEPGDERSIVDYFDAASYGKVSLAPAAESFGVDDDGVIGPLSLPLPHPNTGRSPGSHVDAHHEIYEHAIAAADPFIDFAAFDVRDQGDIDGDGTPDGDGVLHPSELSIILVMAGYENVYSVREPSVHASAQGGNGSIVHTDDTFVLDGQIQQIALPGSYAIIGEMADDLAGPYGDRATPLGTFVHELGHLTFGLPDLYDRTGLLGGHSGGVGHFGLMDQGSHGRDPTRDAYPGETPVLPTAWSQLKLDWVRRSANFGIGGLATSAGAASSFTLDPKVGFARLGEIDPTSGALICHAHQYFLAQYRTAEGYDRGLSAVLAQTTGTEFDGVVIYHVDERRSHNDIAANKLLDVEEAGTPYLLTPILSDGQAAAPHHLWGYTGLGGQTVFDDASTPNSRTADSNMPSGVAITVGARGSTRGPTGPVRTIGLSIDSLCGAPRI